MIELLPFKTVNYKRREDATFDGVVVTPKDGYFMDPNAFYRLQPPYDSQSLMKLPKYQKKVSVPYIKTDGTLVPAGTKRIWPYVCK